MGAVGAADTGAGEEGLKATDPIDQRSARAVVARAPMADAKRLVTVRFTGHGAVVEDDAGGITAGRNDDWAPNRH